MTNKPIEDVLRRIRNDCDRAACYFVDVPETVDPYRSGYPFYAIIRDAKAVDYYHTALKNGVDMGESPAVIDTLRLEAVRTFLLTRNALTAEIVMSEDRKHYTKDSAASRLDSIRKEITRTLTRIAEPESAYDKALTEWRAALDHDVTKLIEYTKAQITALPTDID